MKSVGELKLVGELLVSTPFMGLSICLPLSVFPYFHLFMELYQSMGLSIYISLCISLYMGLSICLLSFCIFFFSSLLLNRIKDAMEVIVVYKLGRDSVDFMGGMD